MGGKGVWNGRGWRDVNHALAQTLLLLIVLIVLIETFVVVILVLNALVLEYFSGEEVDRAGNNLGWTKVSRPLCRKRRPLREE